MLIKALENVNSDTVRRVRQLFAEEGVEAPINRNPHRKVKPKRLDGAQEAKLIARCFSQAPAGRSRWTLKLFANQLVEMEIVDSIAPETGRQTLKK